MKVQIRRRDRRAMAVLVAAVVFYFATTEFALPAYDRFMSAGGAAAEKEDQLRKYRRALVRKGRYMQLLEQARKQIGEVEPLLLRGDNPSLASAELQSFVEKAAEKVGISLSQRSISGAQKKDEFFRETTMAVAFECTVNQLVSFLAELRTAPKFSTVRAAQVTPVQVVHEAPKGGDLSKTVRVNLTVAGLM